VINLASAAKDRLNRCLAQAFFEELLVEIRSLCLENKKSTPAKVILSLYSKSELRNISEVKIKCGLMREL